MIGEYVQLNGVRCYENYEGLKYGGKTYEKTIKNQETIVGKIL